MNDDDRFDALDGSRHSCNFLNFNEFILNFNSNKYHNSFSVLNINLNSINANFEYLVAFLNSIKIKFCVIVLTETWLTADSDVSYVIPGYSACDIYHNSHRGGIKIFINKSFPFIKLKSLSIINDLFQSLCLKINLGNKKNLYILGLYRSPSGSRLDFNSSFSDLILNKIQSNRDFILAGDFNMDLVNPDDNLQINNFMNLMFNRSFIPLIKCPTHLNPITLIPSTLLDQIWTNLPMNSASAVLDYRFNYHLPVCSFIPNLSKNPIVETEFRNFSESNITRLKNDLPNLNLNLNLNSHPRSLVDSFNSWLTDIIDKYFPIKHKKISIKRLKSPWLTNDLMLCINKKHKLRSDLCKNLITKESYVQYKNLLSHTLKFSRQLYYLIMFDEAKSDISKSWKIVHSLLSRGDSSSINSLKINGQNVSDQLQIANHFSNYFLNAPINVIDNIPPCLDNSIVDHFSLENSLYFYPSDVNEIKKIISSLKNKKPSLHDIPVKLFKLMIDTLSPLISSIFNICFFASEYPDALKIARVVPIFKKKGDPEDIEQYRPISVLSNLNKIFEKIIYNRLINFFNCNNIFSKAQFGFFKGKSTFHACYKILSYIQPIFTEKIKGVAIFIDFSKAFDTISHAVLLNKLYNYGIRGYPYYLVKSYLANRKQFVKVGKSSSVLTDCSFGVPQGSNLGPLFFNIYVNEIESIFPELKVVQYADDTVFILTGTNLNEIFHQANLSLIKFSNWCSLNTLAINISKTKFVLFSPGKHDIVPHMYINNSLVSQVNSYKYLGLTIDQNLKFNIHINELKCKAAQLAGVSYKIGKYLSYSSALSFYFSLVQSILAYHISLWGSSSVSNFNSLSLQQNIIVRNLFCHHFPSANNTSSLYKLTRILKLSELYKYNLSIISHQSLNSLKYPSITLELNNLQWSHGIDTRQVHPFRLPRSRVLPDLNSFIFQACRNFNYLPSHLREITSLPKFKKRLLIYLSVDY